MTKEQQNLAWQCLPKEVRKKIKSIYTAHTKRQNIASQDTLLDKMFGRLNLTSNEEPKELLFVERSKVMRKYKFANICEKDHPDKKYWEGAENTLIKLFGDKCLPDKETSVKVEPKFKVGDKVRHTGQNHEIGEIVAYWPDEKFCYSVRFGKEYHNMAEHQLEPYTEPKFHVGDKFRFKKNHSEVHTVASICEDGKICFWEEDADGLSKQYVVNPEYIELYTEPETKSFKVGDKVRVKGDTKVREVYRVLPDGKVMFGDKGSTHLAINLELVEPEIKDNMEEKELNLVELLKGFEGERVYSLMFGEVTFKQIIEESNLSVGEKPIVTSLCSYLPNAMYGLDGVPTLFPSRALYEKYPLDAYSAWMEWKSERTPKRWRAEKWKPYWYLDRRLISKECTADVNSDFDRTNYKNGNMFRSKEEAQQAAEAVRECLAKFHEENTK